MSEDANPRRRFAGESPRRVEVDRTVSVEGRGLGSGPGTDSGTRTGTDSGTGTDTRAGTGTDTGTRTGTDSGTGTDTGTRTGTDSGTGTGTDTRTGTGTGTGTGTEKRQRGDGDDDGGPAIRARHPRDRALIPRRAGSVFRDGHGSGDGKVRGGHDVHRRGNVRGGHDVHRRGNVRGQQIRRRVGTQLRERSLLAGRPAQVTGDPVDA